MAGPLPNGRIFKEIKNLSLRNGKVRGVLMSLPNPRRLYSDNLVIQILQRVVHFEDVRPPSNVLGQALRIEKALIETGLLLKLKRAPVANEVRRPSLIESSGGGTSGKALEREKYKDEKVSKSNVEIESSLEDSIGKVTGRVDEGSKCGELQEYGRGGENPSGNELSTEALLRIRRILLGCAGRISLDFELSDTDLYLRRARSNPAMKGGPRRLTMKYTLKGSGRKGSLKKRRKDRKFE